MLINVHGAGAPRADLKIGDPALYAAGHGPQNDEVRILNCARAVRTVDSNVSGDCNSDGSINILDSLLATRSSIGIVQLTSEQFTRCNASGELEPAPLAQVGIIDALVIAQRPGMGSVGAQM